MGLLDRLQRIGRPPGVRDGVHPQVHADSLPGTMYPSARGQWDWPGPAYGYTGPGGSPGTDPDGELFDGTSGDLVSWPEGPGTVEGGRWRSPSVAPRPDVADQYFYGEVGEVDHGWNRLPEDLEAWKPSAHGFLTPSQAGPQRYNPRLSAFRNPNAGLLTKIRRSDAMITFAVPDTPAFGPGGGFPAGSKRPFNTQLGYVTQWPVGQPVFRVMGGN